MNINSTTRLICTGRVTTRVDWQDNLQLWLVQAKIEGSWYRVGSAGTLPEADRLARSHIEMVGALDRGGL